VTALLGDEISRTARQVRSLFRNPKAVHQLVGAIWVAGEREYKTACHKELPTDAAVLTTARPTCEQCREAGR
jgi:hypothetical protein